MGDINLGGDLHIYGTIAFSMLGYFSGRLLRNIGMLQIIIAILLIPASIETLRDLNDVISATLPYLFFALIGYLGIKKCQYYLLEISDVSRDMVRRIK